MTKLRSLLPGDQLNLDAAAFDGFDPEQDMDRIAEVEEESRNVRSSKQRIVLFLVTMRHFALDSEKRRRPPCTTPNSMPLTTPASCACNWRPMSFS
jgi:deoxyribodipyrimidine photolyase-related protein